MTREVMTIRADVNASVAAGVLLDHKFGCLPVVDREGVLVGIVTEHDFLRFATKVLEITDQQVVRAWISHTGRAHAVVARFSSVASGRGGPLIAPTCAQEVIMPANQSSCFVQHRTTSIPTTAGLVPITDVMTRDVVCARADLPTASIIDLVVNRYIGCLPVIDDEGCPIGMITKRDLVEPLANRGTTAETSPVWCDLAPATAEELMLPLAFTLDEHATILQAAAMMALEDLHHVPVVSANGSLIGVVSSLDIVRWLVKNDGLMSAPDAR